MPRMSVDLLSDARVRRASGMALMEVADENVIAAEKRVIDAKTNGYTKVAKAHRSDVEVWKKVQKLAAREIAAAQKQIDEEEGTLVTHDHS